MNQQSFKRYLWLIDTVYQSDQEGITFDKINEKWKESSLSKGKNYPLRTFHNHRKEVREVLNVNIRCRKSTNSYYVDEGKKSNGVMKKMLELMTISQLLEGNADMANKMVMELQPGGECYLSKIMSAIQACKKVAIDHKPFWADDVLHYESFEPYAVKEVKRVWYLVGKRQDGKYEMVDLRQVLALSMQNDQFEYPSEKIVRELVEENYGSQIEEIPTEEITLKVGTALARELRVNPLHSSQIEMEARKTYSIFYVNVKPTQEFCRDVLAYGAAIEILAPLSMRENVVKIAKQIGRKNA